MTFNKKTLQNTNQFILEYLKRLVDSSTYSPQTNVCIVLQINSFFIEPPHRLPLHHYITSMFTNGFEWMLSIQCIFKRNRIHWVVSRIYFWLLLLSCVKGTACAAIYCIKSLHIWRVCAHISQSDVSVSRKFKQWNMVESFQHLLADWQWQLRCVFVIHRCP